MLLARKTFTAFMSLFVSYGVAFGGLKEDAKAIHVSGGEDLRPHYQSALFASAALHNGGTWHHNISLSLISERAGK